MVSFLKYLHKKIIIAIFAANIGSGFIDGYNTLIVYTIGEPFKGWLNTLLVIERGGIKLSKEEFHEIWEWFTATFYVGAAVGCLFAPCIANKFGRKIGILLNNLTALLGILLVFFARGMESYRMMISGRFISGINCGINEILCPMFLCEISPIRLRGAITGGTYGTMLACSMFMAEIIGNRRILGTEDKWHFLFLVPIIPSLIQLVLLSFCPESPKFLHINRDEEEHAEEALAWYRNTWDVEDELNDIKQEKELLKEEPKVTFMTLFEDSPLRDPLLIVFVMVAAKRMTGIDALKVYRTVLHDALEVDLLDISLDAIALFVSIFTTGMSLRFLETCGRRKLALFSYASLVCSTIILFVAHELTKYYSSLFNIYLFLFALILFNIMFNAGLSPISFVVGQELFGQTMRPFLVSITFSVNWIIGAIFAKYSDEVFAVVHHYIFLIFTFFEVCSFILIYRHFGESANKSIVEIMRMYEKWY